MVLDQYTYSLLLSIYNSRNLSMVLDFYGSESEPHIYNSRNLSMVLDPHRLLCLLLNLQQQKFINGLRRGKLRKHITLSTTVEIYQWSQTISSIALVGSSTTVEIYQWSQTNSQRWCSTHLQQQKFINGLRLQLILSSISLIYNSRNLSMVLDT